MRLLVLAPARIGPDDVRRALSEDVDGAEVRVVSPALNDSPLAFWVSDSDDAIAEAEETQRESVGALRGAGARATGDTGESDPLVALQDEFATFAADRILIFVREDDEQSYRENEVRDAESRFGIPVTLAVLDD